MLRVAALFAVLGFLVGVLAAVGIAGAVLKLLCGFFFVIALFACASGMYLGRRGLSVGRPTDRTTQIED